MSMFKCLNCKAEFEEPGEVIDYIDGRPVLKYRVCPECHIDDIEKLRLCDCQRNYITDEQDRCDRCDTEISEAMQQARQTIMNARNMSYQTALEDMVWWIEKEG